MNTILISDLDGAYSQCGVDEPAAGTPAGPGRCRV